VTVNVGVATVNEGNVQGQTGEVVAGTAMPSMTIRFGSGPASPEVALGQARVSKDESFRCFWKGNVLTQSWQPLSSPNKQRGASLPSRPAQWSPTHETWTSASIRSSPMHLTSALEQAPPEATAQQSMQDQASYGTDVYGPMIMPPMMPVQWHYPPNSPLSVTTQPTTAVHSPSSPFQSFKLPAFHDSCDQPQNDGSPIKTPASRGSLAEQQAGTANWMHAPGGLMMMAPPLMHSREHGGPCWPAVTVDQFGQQYFLHPIGSFCPSMMPAGGHLPMQAPMHHQQHQEENRNEQREVSPSRMTEHSQGRQYHSYKDEQREGMPGMSEGHLMGPPLGVPPQFYPTVPPGNPSLWTMQPVPFIEQTATFGYRVSRETGKHGSRASVSPGHGYHAHVGPIQIPAVSDSRSNVMQADG
jgi:hypothetical protein